MRDKSLSGCGESHASAETFDWIRSGHLLLVDTRTLENRVIDATYKQRKELNGKQLECVPGSIVIGRDTCLVWSRGGTPCERRVQALRYVYCIRV